MREISNYFKRFKKDKSCKHVIIKDNYGKDKVIGYLDTIEKSFKKKVKKSRHLFKKFNAWGLDAKYFTEKILPENLKIIIFEEEERKVYIATANLVKDKGVFYHFKNGKGNDYGAQIFLPITEWSLMSFAEYEEEETKKYLI